ncbi:MAG: hypothetical protein ACFCU8_02210 [Thermosynechococcaceae cyanobacterium]
MIRRLIWVYAGALLAIASCNSAPSSVPEQTTPPSSATDTAASDTAESQVQINEPNTGTKVGLELPVKGTSPAPGEKVWLIVHPTHTADYWVQPPAASGGEGEWETVIFIGREGTEDVGQSYDIKAVVNPKSPLKEGDVLKDWSEGEFTSTVTQVERK